MGGITSLKRHLHNAIADNLVIPAGSRHLCGVKEPEFGRDEVILLCVLRDGAEYIHAFMEHYQKLGVAHMVFLDNGSRDNTVELLSGYDNVTVYQTHLPYKHYFRNFKRYLAKRFASDRWFLCVDIDEFFEYPHQDRLPLNQLVSYLDKRGFNAVRSVMLDMFSDVPIYEDEGQSRAFSRQRYAYFESASIEKKFFPAVRARKKRSRRNIEPRDDLYIAIGGVRKRCFGVADRFPGIKKVFLIRNPFAVVLSKYNKRNWHWLEEPSQLLAQQSLHHDHLKPFEDLILGVGDDYIERQVLIWAILHYVPLAQLDLDQVHVVFYEHLYADPESELGALFHYLQRPEAGEENPGYLDAVNRPSWVSGSSSNIILGRSPISQWRKELSSRQIDRGREILERFGLDGLYAGDDLPNKAFLRDRLLNPASPM